MPSLDKSSNADCVSPANARFAIKMETVKPIPPKKVTPAIICHVVSSGMGASRNLTVSHEKQKIPKNLPSTRDTIMVSVIPSNIAPGFISNRKIPALVNAKSGTIK